AHGGDVADQGDGAQVVQGGGGGAGRGGGDERLQLRQDADALDLAERDSAQGDGDQVGGEGVQAGGQGVLQGNGGHPAGGADRDRPGPVSQGRRGVRPGLDGGQEGGPLGQGLGQPLGRRAEGPGQLSSLGETQRVAGG